jgi:hypothetical protein
MARVTLSIQESLTFKSETTYTYTYRAKNKGLGTTSERPGNHTLTVVSRDRFGSEQPAAYD